LKSKGECLSRFKEFKAFVKKQTRERIKALRNDNRGEFKSREFQEFLNSHGIHHQTSAPYYAKAVQERHQKNFGMGENQQ
jgi:hypothetical protein